MENSQFQERIVRMGEVVFLTGYKPSSIYALISEGKFPKAIKLGKRASGWWLSQINQWMADRANTPAINLPKIVSIQKGISNE
jgi:prophage regulatory protein